MKFYDNKVEFEREDFTDEQFNMLKMMVFNLAGQMTHVMNDGIYYGRDFTTTLFELCGKLGIQDLFY